MSYIVIKVVNGRRYRYEQRTWREGRRVRTESRYLGPADGGARRAAARPRRKGMLGKLGELIAANTLTAEERARLVDEVALLKEVKARDAARAKARTDFEKVTGVKLGPSNPTPIDKPLPAIDLAHSAAAAPAPTGSAPATEGPAAGATGPEGST